MCPMNLLRRMAVSLLVALSLLCAASQQVVSASDFADSFHALAERYYVATGNDYYALTGSQGAPPNIHGNRLQATDGGDFYDEDFILGGPERIRYLVQCLGNSVIGVLGYYIEKPLFPPSNTTYYQTQPLPLPGFGVTSASLYRSHAEANWLINQMRYLNLPYSTPRTRGCNSAVGYYVGGTTHTPGGSIPCGPIYSSPSSAFSAALGLLPSPVISEYAWGDNVPLTSSSVSTNWSQYDRSTPCTSVSVVYEPGTIFTASLQRREYYFTADVSRITGSVDLYLRFDPGLNAQPGAAPGPLDGQYHSFKTYPGGGTISEWINEDILPTRPSGTPTPNALTVNTYAVMRMPYLIADCTFTRNPGSLPFFPPVAPPPTCRVGIGALSKGNSIIDNHQFSHQHEASDYGDASMAFPGCGSCGSAGSDDGELPSLTWRRFHRYCDQDHFGHFGPGVFSNFDVRVQVDTVSNTMTLWDAQNPLELELKEGTTPGNYSDTRWSRIHAAELLDAVGAHAANDTTAAWVQLRTWEGTRYRFELFNLRTGDLGTRAGRLSTITDRNGNALTLAYADAVSATDTALGHDRSRLWRIASITDSYGEAAVLTWTPYLGAWVVASISVPNGSTILYDYDRTGLIGLNRVRHPDGTVSTFATSADGANQQQVITFDDAGAEDIHRRKTSHVTWSAMNDLGVPGLTGRVPVAPNRIRMVKNGAGEVSYQNWGHSYGQVYASYIYEGGKTASDPGSFMRYETQNGAPYRVARAASFSITGWQWSASSWEIIEEYSVATDTRINRMRDSQGRTTVYQRTVGGSISAETVSAADGVTQFSSASTTYNAFEEPTLTVDGVGREVEYTYDVTGNRLIMTAAPDEDEESTWSWTYNIRGQPLTATDANGNVTTYIYGETAGANDHKRLISLLEPADILGGARATTLFTYDTVGRLKTVTDPVGRVTTYNYDSRNRASSITYADTSSETWTYGTTAQTANLLISHKDRNNNVETFAYDDAGRRTSTTIAGPGGTPVVGTTTWTYLPGKDLIKTVSENGELTTYGYDYQLRQISTTRSPRAGAGLTSSTVYDQTQRIAFTSDPYGRRTYYWYDRNDNVARTVRELVAGALTVPGDDAASITSASSATRTLAPNPAYVIEEQVYDNEGQLLQRVDGRGYRSFFEYDRQGRLVAQTESANLATRDPAANQEVQWVAQLVNGSWVYVAQGYLPPDPKWFQTEAARTQYAYDPQGNRTQVIKPKAFTRSSPATLAGGNWQEQPYGTMFRVPDPTFTLTNAGFTTTTTYTGRNLVASITEALGTADEATVAYTYTLTKKKATETDPRNTAWKTTYAYQTCCDRVSSVTDAASKVTTYTYDANGNVLTVRDPNNVGTTNTYDARNRVLTATNTLNHITSFAYDDNLVDGNGLSATYATQFANLGLGAGADGSAVRVTNHLGEISLEVRDGVGRVVRRVDGNLNRTTAAYDFLVGGLVETQISDALGNTTRQQADAAGRVRVSVDATGQPTTAMFDANGNQVSVRDANFVGWTVPDDGAAVAGYDHLNRLRKRTDTHGDTTQYSYDRHGNVVATTDALNNTDTCAYDYRDRKVQCTDRVGGVTTYTYDKANHLTKIADADSAVNGVTDYTYDSRGLLGTETFPAGQAGKRTRRTYTYDNGKRLKTRTTATTPAATPALNEVTTYNYDLGNRLTGRTYNDGKGNDTFTYDNAGRLTKAVSGRYGSTVDRVYTGNTPAEKAGRLTSEKLTLSGANAGNWTVKYAYDAANRLTTLTYPANETSVRTYTPRNQLQGLTFAGSSVATRTYDNGGRLTGTTFGNSLVETRTYRSDANGVDNQLATQVIPGVTNFTYAYDANKRITQETNGIFAAQTQQFLAYDNENRLTSWKRGTTETQTWQLSKVGDWQSTTVNGVAQPRAHSAVHEVTSIGVTPLAYDLKGNLTQNQDGALYSWDSENRLTAATVADTDYGVTDVAGYRYDALGRRVQKTVYGMTTTFIHAGAQVIHEFDAKVQLPSSAATDDGTGAGTPPGGGILQGAGVTRFNYQPSLSPIPPGFFADKGSVFGVRSNGKSYGWLTTARTATVIRNQHPYPQFDSFNQAWLNNTGSAGTWEIALANGTYAVVVVMGDPASANQTNNLTIEGQAQTDPDPAVATPPGYRRGDFDGYAVTANVTDGLLTLSIPATANNPKLCFIEIGPQGSSITQADRDRLAAAIEDASSDTGLPPFPKPQPTPRQYAYGSYVDEPLLMRAAGTRYYYASNRLYSVAAITTQTGQVAERYKYDAYGKQGVLAENGVVAYKPSDYGQFKGFTGYRTDSETKLYDARTRVLDPETGRFIARMPWWRSETSWISAYDNSAHSMDPQTRDSFAISDREELTGNYFDHRFNLYDFMSNSPSNHLEPYSTIRGTLDRNTGEMTMTSDLHPGQSVSFDARTGGAYNAPDIQPRSWTPNGLSETEYGGPIPAGMYHIVPHQKEGADYPWYGLRKDDWLLDDQTVVGGIGGWLGTSRDGFRLHVGTSSLGCITVDKGRDKNIDNYKKLVEWINATPFILIDIDPYMLTPLGSHGIKIKTYGTILVR